jgi:hypothetical protein
MKCDISEASSASDTLCFIEKLDDGQSPKKKDYVSEYCECFFLIHYSNPSVYELSSFKNCM